MLSPDTCDRLIAFLCVAFIAGAVFSLAGCIARVCEHAERLFYQRGNRTDE